MALDATALHTIIESYLTSYGFHVHDVAGRDEKYWLHLFVMAVSQGVVDHIHAAARAVGEDSEGDDCDLPIV